MLLRKKLGPGAHDNEDVISIPSNVSDNHWAELPKYQAMKHLEQLNRDKEEAEKKKSMIKSTLDKQIMEQ